MTRLCAREDLSALTVGAIGGIEWDVEDTAEVIEDIAEVIVEVVVVGDIGEDEI